MCLHSDVLLDLRMEALEYYHRACTPSGSPHSEKQPSYLCAIKKSYCLVFPPKVFTAFYVVSDIHVSFHVGLLSSPFLPTNNHKVNKLLIVPKVILPCEKFLAFFTALIYKKYNFLEASGYFCLNFLSVRKGCCWNCRNKNMK